MGGPPVTSRGGMVHLILSLCRQFEEAFGKAVDGGKGGGEQILRVFEERLGQNIQQLQFKKVGFPKATCSGPLHIGLAWNACVFSGHLQNNGVCRTMVGCCCCGTCIHLCSSPHLCKDDHASTSQAWSHMLAICGLSPLLHMQFWNAYLTNTSAFSAQCSFCQLPSGHMQILEPSNVKRIVEEADGYQPHLIAPEMGYRRLLQECLVLFKGPADTAVGEVHHVLRSIVASTINSEDCKNLQQYTSLKREIVATASSSLGESCATAASCLGQVSFVPLLPPPLVRVLCPVLHGPRQLFAVHPAPFPGKTFGLAKDRKACPMLVFVYYMGYKSSCSSGSLLAYVEQLLRCSNKQIYQANVPVYSCGLVLVLQEVNGSTRDWSKNDKYFTA